MHDSARVKRYEPCDCEGMCEWRGYPCAVHYMIARFGIDPNCECRAGDGPLCVACEAGGEREKGPPSPLPAFQAAQPPYRDLARFLSNRAGLRMEKDETGRIRAVRDREQAARQLVEASFSDPLAYDAALWMAAECIRYDLKVPEALREWAFFAITGCIERPKLKGRYPPALQWRDDTIVELVCEVSGLFDLPPTAAGDDGGESACAAVAEALRLMRLQPDSYQHIRRIWKNRRRPRGLPEWAR